MKLKSLIIADGAGNLENVEMIPAEDNIQKQFSDFKVWKVKDGDSIFYVNSLYISSFEIKKQD